MKDKVESQNLSFGQKLKTLRKEKKMTQTELANKLHLNDKSSISRYEKDENTPQTSVISEIAKIFNVTTDYLLGNENKKTDDTDLFSLKGDVKFTKQFTDNKMLKIPVIGVIKAGIPMLADENIIDYEYIHQEDLKVGEEYFYLQIKGDSMINARIFDGDRVLIRKQNFIENDGDIMAVRVNGDEATLKRVFRQESGLVLQSENQNYTPMFYPSSDIDTGYVGIIGKAIEVKIKL